MAARPKKRTTEVLPSSTNPFVDALKFLSIVTKEVGPPNETHVYLRNGFATASNGTLAAGIKITDDLFAAPNNKLMIEALSKCGQNLSITQLDNNRLSIKSDKFKAIVPCIDPNTLQFSIPDGPVGNIDNSFKAAIEAISSVPFGATERVVDHSILMNGQSVIATNGYILIEAWHGIDLPSGIALPKDIIKSLSSKNLKQFGFSSNSFTFWFDDESWIKTQIMAKEWPNVTAIIEGPSNPFPLPVEFWQAVSAVAPFSESGSLYFNKERLCSHNTEGVGASFEVAGLPAGPVYSAKQLQLIKPLAETIDFIAPLESGYCLRFFGSKVRGIITGRNGE